MPASRLLPNLLELPQLLAICSPLWKLSDQIAYSTGASRESVILMKKGNRAYLLLGMALFWARRMSHSSTSSLLNCLTNDLSRFASMFPDKIGRMVVDGVSNPHDYYNGTVARIICYDRLMQLASQETIRVTLWTQNKL